MLLLSIFAGTALALATVGVYGVMSYSVTQRLHEMGIRIALGASAGDLTLLVVGHEFKLAVAGVLVGLLGAFALTRLLSTLLFGIEPTAPLTFVCVSVLLVSIAGLPVSYRHGEPPRSMQWSCSGMSEAHRSTPQTVGKITCAGSVLEGLSPRRP